jgi:hypothetical protein
MKQAGDEPHKLNGVERFLISPRGREVRVVLISIICSGVVALFIGRAIEVQISNDQTARNRTNCNLIQSDRLDRIDSLNESAAAAGQQADSILGNKRPLIYKKGELIVGKPVKRADFSKPPYKQFKDFKPLIIAQAHNNRSLEQRNLRRAEQTKSRIENCSKVFPKSKTFWIL